MFTCYHCVARYPDNFTIYDTLNSTYQLPLGSDAEFTCLAAANDVTTLEYRFQRTDNVNPGSNVDRPDHDGPTIAARTTMSITGITTANGGEYECIVRGQVDRSSIELGSRTFTIAVSCTYVSQQKIYKNVTYVNLKLSSFEIAH